MHNDTRVSDGKGSKPDITIIIKVVQNDINVFLLKNDCWMPLGISYNILDVSAYSAFLLWTEKHPTWNAGWLHKRRLFLSDLTKL
ncbi:hypothetical protein T4A_7254 [Trichinella pseudospiralis]|uniref:Uncharacterized protein n=1 Tax=Trichinella pseudospiralis TaxID=6337 RepID=A0A0V1J6B6_TRIPS|nr:hypothetical protein T4A_7254 [Trichinella pseudospiralis]KRZ30535.1 hypothetical protein T4C_12943 [Trichinella pseudospiralis]